MIRVLDKEKTISYFDWLEEIKNDEESELSSRILKLRNLMESFYQDISKDFKESFPNLYSRFTYANEYYNIDNDLQANLNGIRIFLNKVIHNEIKEYSQHKLTSILFYLYELICQFTDKRLVSFDNQVKNIELVSFTKLKKSSHKQIDQISLRVTEFELIQQDNHSYKSQIEGYEEDGEEAIKVLVWDIKDSNTNHDTYLYGKKIGSIAKLVWKGCQLTFYNIKQNSNDEKVYFTQATSKIILESDFLIDATTIAKCFQNKIAYHKLALVSLFDKVGINIPIVIGNFVNQMLDRMIASKTGDFTSLFKECVHTSILTSLSLGVKNLLAIMEEIRTNHFSNLENLCEKIKDIKVTTEPTFYSPEYGLFGRLDGLLEDETDDPNRRSIFELKSGSLPQYGVWINHAVQVYVYDMLLRSLYGETRTGSSMIFYSKDKKEELRNVPPAPFMEQHILMVRNCIVSEFKAIAEGRIDIVEYFNEIDITKIPKFSKESFLALKDSFIDLSLQEKAYFNQYLSFLFREIWASKTGDYRLGEDLNSSNTAFSGLWKSCLLEKQANPRAITNLRFVGQEDNQLVFARPQEKKTLSLREGDRVILYLFQDKVASQVLKCSLLQIETNYIYLKPKHAEINKNIFSNEENWVIEADKNDANLFGLISSLSDFMTSSSLNRQLLLGQIQPRSKSTLSYQDADEYLNPIVQKALSAQDYFLLQGPPGTGKTSSFLMKCIRYLAENTSEKLLILAFTNRAIDEVCLKLNNAQLDYLRLGSQNDDEIKSLTDLCKPESKLQEIASQLDNYRILCSTVASYHSNKEALHSIISFDTLFVDEASQLIEPELIGITKNFQRFILIGDQNQLPAISIQDDENQKCSDTNLNSMSIHNYRQSLFERLFANAQAKGWTQAYHTLTYHYRMHQDIAHLININYDNKLRTRIDRQINQDFLLNYQTAKAKPLINILKSSRCIFIDLPDKRSSKISLREAQACRTLIATIKEALGKKFNSNSLGLICNWRSQINLIKEITRELLEENEVTIDTVERYQGSERDIIIYSLTVNYHHQLDLLQSLTQNRKVDRKLNVALSRSREQVIVLGNASLLASLPQYAALIDLIKRSFLFISFNEAEECLLKKTEIL